MTNSKTQYFQNGLNVTAYVELGIDICERFYPIVAVGPIDNSYDEETEEMFDKIIKNKAA